MGRGKRGRVRGAAARRQRAITAANHLSAVLDYPWHHSDATVNAAASQLWRVSRRHRIKIQSKNRIWICRGCKSPLRPGVTARIRIRSGMRITTCNKCGLISRRGPDFPHEVNE